MGIHRAAVAMAISSILTELLADEGSRLPRTAARKAPRMDDSGRVLSSLPIHRDMQLRAEQFRRTNYGRKKH